jgi:hypothetical protein
MRGIAVTTLLRLTGYERSTAGRECTLFSALGGGIDAGFIPEGACWSLAALVLEYTIEGDHRNVVHVDTHLIEAESPEQAYEKAIVERHP